MIKLNLGFCGSWHGQSVFKTMIWLKDPVFVSVLTKFRCLAKKIKIKWQMALYAEPSFQCCFVVHFIRLAHFSWMRYMKILVRFWTSNIKIWGLNKFLMSAPSLQVHACYSQNLEIWIIWLTKDKLNMSSIHYIGPMTSLVWHIP